MNEIETEEMMRKNFHPQFVVTVEREKSRM